MKLNGKKVSIRTPKPDELNFIKELWTDPKTMKEVGGIVKINKSSAQKWYKKMVDPEDGKNHYFLIFNSDKETVGEVSFHRFDPKRKVADLNIKVKYEHRGKGYGREALTLLLDFYFNEFEGKIMQDKVAANNQVGKSVLTKFGFNKKITTKDFDLYIMTKDRFNDLYKNNN